MFLLELSKLLFVVPLAETLNHKMIIHLAHILDALTRLKLASPL